jgi:hypothetical protein
MKYFPFDRGRRDWITGCDQIFVNVMYCQSRKFLSIDNHFILCNNIHILTIIIY